MRENMRVSVCETVTVYQNDVPTAKFAPNHEMIKHFKLVILSRFQYKTKPKPSEQCTENEFFFISTHAFYAHITETSL